MKNKKQIIYLIIFLAVILISVVGATYAYFESTTSLDSGELSTLTKTAGKTTFTAYSENNIEFNVTASSMTQANTSSNAVESDDATIKIKIDTENANQGTACTFDLYWVWDSDDRYTEADTDLPYINEEGLKSVVNADWGEGEYEEHKKYYMDEFPEEWEKAWGQFWKYCDNYVSKSCLEYVFPYEMSVSVKRGTNGYEDIYELSELEWSEDKKEALIGRPTLVTAINSIEVDFSIIVNVYNIPVVQNKLYNKNFKAHIEVRNSSCEPIELLSSEQEGMTLADSIRTLYANDGNNYLYLHDGKGNYINSDLEAGDNSLRYAGDSPNILCFGDDCTDRNNLYHIIGVFDNQVKVAKFLPAGRDLLGTDGDYYQSAGNELLYYWSKDKEKTFWNETDLNKINLNTNFINNIGEKWSNMIADTRWVISGGPFDKIVDSRNAKIAYDYEVASVCDYCSNKADYVLSEPTKVGLPYMSDFYYASNPKYWDNLFVYMNNSLQHPYFHAQEDTAFFYGFSWTISRSTSKNYQSFDTCYDDWPYQSLIYYNWYYVLPTFYLKPDVKYVGGTGTGVDPIRIEL